MRNKNLHPKTPFSLLPPLPGLNITPNLSGNGGWGQSIMCCLCCFFLLSGKTSSIGSLPQGTILHELLTIRVFPMGCSSSGTAPACVPFHGLLSFTCRLLYCGSPMGSQPPLCILLFQCSLLHGLQVDLCPPWSAGAQLASPWAAT